MKLISYDNQNFQEELGKILDIANNLDSEISSQVASIISSVKTNGDKAIIDICNQFDGSKFIKSEDLLVSDAEIDEALKNLDPQVFSALKLAFERITIYHKKQLPSDFEYIDESGVKLGNKWKSIESVCVYAPGGTAIYPSSVLMSAVPAIIAGVKDIVVTIPSKDGKIHDAVLAACNICGIKKIYKIGGAAAIAAFAYGTQSISKVNKIVGPGNSYVAIAKKQLFGVVGIDMIAGPTDILVISDAKTNPAWVAADLLSQLEHGPDSKAILISDNEEFAKNVIEQIKLLTKELPRQNIIKNSLKNSHIIIVKNLVEDGSEIANKIAPEHLEIMTDNPQIIADKITNAGAIFLGRYTPEAIGDYIAGPSHTLPTMSSAKFSSGLSVFDFLKRISIISCNQESFLKLHDATSILAKIEGFDAHKLSVNIRR